MAKKVLRIIARQTNAPYGGNRVNLYLALAKVFVIPALEQLWSNEGLDEFYSQWENDSNFGGPAVYFDRHGFPVLIVTETSGRRIHLVWDTKPGELGPENFHYPLKEVRVVFPEGGSTTAASWVIDHLRKMEETAYKYEIDVVSEGNSQESLVYHLGDCPSLED